mmetsp:Transcript_2669/g.5825  ORF Transcript_2669/g.5825 Transcript_2669/m.5825 type:complete len:149 (-) Transcript_2669:1926-2372(-)
MAATFIIDATHSVVIYELHNSASTTSCQPGLMPQTMQSSIMLTNQIDQGINNTRISESAHVSKLITFTRRNLSQYSSHNLSASRHGERRSNADDVWRSERSDFSTDKKAKLLDQLIFLLSVGLSECGKCDDCLTLDRMWPPNNCCLGH